MADEAKTKRPLDTPFRQQTLKAWRPILTPKAVIITFSIVGVLFIPIGVLILSESDKVIEVDNKGGDYSALCCVENCDATDGTRVDMNPCTINITIAETMEKPIYMYYKLSDFYQNHRRYVKSRHDAQLRGVSTQTPDLLEADCTSYYRHNESHAGDAYNSISNVISPCGLIAWSVFNDSFSLVKEDGTKVAMLETGVAWPSDVSDKFHNAGDSSTGTNFPPFAHWKQASCSGTVDGVTLDASKLADCEAANPDATTGLSAGWCFFGSGYCNEDEHFMVWMRTAGLPTFRKLYAIIDEDLAPGDYSIVVSNGVEKEHEGEEKLWNYYHDKAQTQLFPVHGFDGEKHIVLSTVSWMGGKNPFLGYAYVVVGAICLTLALLFLIKDRLSPRRLGDPSYITFNKKEGDK